MIKWMRPMYMDEAVKEKVAVIRYRFKFKKFPGNYYFVILPDGQDMPEIIRASYLKQAYYKSRDYTIIGIASGKTAAMELFKDMAEDAYKTCNNVNIRAFLEQAAMKE